MALDAGALAGPSSQPAGGSSSQRFTSGDWSRTSAAGQTVRQRTGRLRADRWLGAVRSWFLLRLAIPLICLGGFGCSPAGGEHGADWPSQIGVYADVYPKWFFRLERSSL